jgi:hypothetical protein
MRRLVSTWESNPRRCGDMAKLTTAQARAYFEKDGVVCPYCGSDKARISGGDEGPDAIWQNVWCGDCDGEWTDKYELVALTEGSDPDWDWRKDDLIPPRNQPMLWGVLYTHKHGIDIFACWSEEAAQRQALHLVKTYRDDFDVEEDVTDEEALSDWQELTGGTEFIETTGHVTWVEHLREEEVE